MDAPITESEVIHATTGWRMPWGIEPSHLAQLSFGDIVVLMLVFLVLLFATIMLVLKLRNHDKFYDGYMKGYHAGLNAKAKQRWHRDIDTVVSIVSEEEYRATMDQVTV